jgi:hypothetical protein
MAMMRNSDVLSGKFNATESVCSALLKKNNNNSFCSTTAVPNGNRSIA